MIVVTVAGYQDSGKTTLVERLVPALSSRGSVATVKSIHHDVEFDTPGKDTYRHRTAGADAVVGLTPSQTFSIAVDGTDEDRDPDASLERGLAHLGPKSYDYVVGEGFKRATVPTILVGDIDDEAVEGAVLERVRDAESVPVDRLADAIDGLPE
ncbi:MAG: molybdopterin-guanine dinucleotide biosynthesis protein B [Halanaeroarchaeum sp.]